MNDAILVLDNDTEAAIVFYGKSIGINGTTVGEVVFNTAITGYQEILSDPSYAEQIITLTYPHIGNVGINDIDKESSHIYAKGLIVRNEPMFYNNWLATDTLSNFLIDNNVVAISNIDTRKLVKIIRTKGVLNGCITTELTVKEALKQAKKFKGTMGSDLVEQVSTKKSYEFNKGSFDLRKKHYNNNLSLKYNLVVYDYGVKTSILRMLADRFCKITVVNARTDAQEILKMKPDGVFLSNGPGDPAPCDYAISNIKLLLKNNVPMFGICLGHQLLGIALGCLTQKMKFGHHGANHPVYDINNDKVIISSQNHCFAISDVSDCVTISHRSLFDNSIQGIVAKNNKAFGFQGHPEASPGPQDSRYLFDDFIKLMQ